MKASKLFLCGASFAFAISMATPTFAAGRGIELTNEYIQKVGTTEHVEGGIWYHDVSTSGDTKTVVSNYQHNSKEHRSSCDIGGWNKVDSGWQDSGIEAKSSTSGHKSLGQAHAYYDTM